MTSRRSKTSKPSPKPGTEKSPPAGVLAGKTALVTGGGQRVGKAIAWALGMAGARVAVHHNRSRAKAERLVAKMHAHGIEAETFAADLQDPNAPASLMSRVRLWGKHLDILVNNAAIFDRRAFEAVPLKALEMQWSLNFRAPFLLSQQAAPLLRKRQGVIVNVLDVAAFAAWKGYSHYCPTKAALAMLTRCLAVELAPSIRVCGVAPGTVMFPDDYDPAEQKRVVSKIPMARVGRAEDVAEAVLYLCTASYVTGAVVPVDGGRLAGTRDLL